MSSPLENHAPQRATAALIDRLVDGELPEGERRDLLLRLANEPDGWRRCALAFLEAQSWRETFGSLAASQTGAARPVIVPVRSDSKPRLRRPLAALAALAAGLLAAFALGWTLHGGTGGNTREPAGESAKGSGLESPSGLSQPAAVEQTAADPRPAGPSEAVAVPDPVVKQWEQRGYHAERQQRVVSMELQNGRRVDVPVQEVRVRALGSRSY